MVRDPVQSKRSLFMGGLALSLAIGLSQDGWTQESGEQVFQTTCFACHTIGGGRLVGPDLLSVHERRSQEWLESFVKSSQSMVDDGDADAVALFEEFSRIPMPDAPVSEQQIRQVLSYIKSQSLIQTAITGASTSAPAAAEVPASEEPASEEDIFTGQELFQGKLRLANGGPACNACHEVRNDAVIGGGILARELTTVFSRMGGAGVKAILGQAPFPVMQAAYEDQSLTDNEVTALVAFLEYADSEQYNQLPRDYGIGLFLSGVVGASVLFGFFGFVWRGRKKESVNQAIFDRQIRSTTDTES
jgi:mono/diheme cytochrome c family protein